MTTILTRWSRRKLEYSKIWSKRWAFHHLGVSESLRNRVGIWKTIFENFLPTFILKRARSLFQDWIRPVTLLVRMFSTLIRHKSSRLDSTAYLSVYPPLSSPRIWTFFRTRKSNLKGGSWVSSITKNVLHPNKIQICWGLKFEFWVRSSGIYPTETRLVKSSLKANITQLPLFFGIFLILSRYWKIFVPIPADGNWNKNKKKTNKVMKKNCLI